MAANGSKPQHESYAHLFVDEEQPTAEYGGGNSDAESGTTTIPPVDQWIHENADVLNQDKYGFGLEQNIDDDDIRILATSLRSFVFTCCS
eukprot:4626522-Amphidinium_carterae.1